jgi:GntR family carbon starvation induced transcriptional regulator
VEKPTTLSLTTAVLDQLRDDILTGALAPGEKLRLEHLTDRYGCGRTPLREACSRLAAEGLVVASEQRGFRVAAVSRDDLLDLTRTRQRVEGLALRDAIQHGDAAWESDVRQALERLTAVPRARRGANAWTWDERHRALHTALLGGSGSPWLMRFFGLLFDQSERYRRLSQVLAGATRDVEGEHEALVRAALDRDAERAAALLTEHIAKTTDVVLRSYPSLAVTSVDDLSTKRARRA